MHHLQGNTKKRPRTVRVEEKPVGRKVARTASESQIAEGACKSAGELVQKSPGQGTSRAVHGNRRKKGPGEGTNLAGEKKEEK